MNMLVELRSSVESDNDTIAQIWHQSASLPGVGPAVMPSEADLRHRVDLELAAGWEVTLAVLEGRTVGFVALKRRESVLAELFVRPASIGLGVGRRLLAHAIATMPAGFTLYTRAGNTKARLFYEREGLVALREDKHPRSGEPVIHYAWNGPPATPEDAGNP